LIDQQLDEAMQNGTFDNLPGRGKPLNLDEDPNTPDDMKLAYKILKENDLAPAWIEEGKELEAAREHLLAQIRKAAVSGTVPQHVRNEVTAYNRRVLTHNLKLPQGIMHKRTINLERELQRT
jgi:hypothetical protein